MSSNYASSQTPLPQKSRRKISPRSAHPRPSASSTNRQQPGRRSIEDEYVFVNMDEPAEYPYSFPMSTGRGSPRHSEAEDSIQSHDPLITSPEQAFRPQNAVAEEDRPLLTLNTLDPVQRAALVRQSRKLHKLLGATPHISDLQPASQGAPRKLQRRGTLAGSDIRLDRNAAMAALESPPLEPPGSAHWAKIPSSLVATAASPNASTNAPVLTLNVVSTPGDVPYPIRPRRLSDSSVASSTASILARRLGSTSSVLQRTSNDSHERVNESNSNKNVPTSAQTVYIPPSPTSPLPTYVSSTVQRQQSRARMAKLQQIMGEPVPSELVMRPQTTGSTEITSSNSGRSRRLSMDLSPLKAVPSLKHKRSRTMWRKDLKENLEFDSAPESSSPKPAKRHGKSKSKDMPPIEDLLLGQLQKAPMSGKQKALNVKRALKMAAVFGVPPPQNLYQVPNKASDSPVVSPLASQQSLASLAYMLDHDRDSLYDLLASTADSGSDDDEDPVNWPYERKSISGPNPVATPSNSSDQPATNVTVAGRPSANILSPPSRGSRPATPSGSRPVPSPLSGNNATPQPQKVSGAPPKSPTRDHEFSSRRRRANKLSRFFGVNYNDLFNSMVYVDSGENQDVPAVPSRTPNNISGAPSAYNPPNRSTSITRNGSAPPAVGVSRSQVNLARTAAVTVQTDSGKATVLRTSANVAADVDADDLDEVMNRLRALKA